MFQNWRKWCLFDILKIQTFHKWCLLPPRMYGSFYVHWCDRQHHVGRKLWKIFMNNFIVIMRIFFVSASFFLHSIVFSCFGETLTQCHYWVIKIGIYVILRFAKVIVILHICPKCLRLLFCHFWLARSSILMVMLYIRIIKVNNIYLFFFVISSSLHIRIKCKQPIFFGMDRMETQRPANVIFIHFFLLFASYRNERNEKKTQQRPYIKMQTFEIVCNTQDLSWEFWVRVMTTHWTDEEKKAHMEKWLMALFWT